MSANYTYRLILFALPFCFVVDQKRYFARLYKKNVFASNVCLHFDLMVF